MPFIRSGDCNVHYEVFGSGPPMLWLHGFTSCAKFWLDLAPQVPGRHVLVDARGHGYSDPSREAPITPETMAEDVVRVMDAAGVDRAVVLGHSMGGMIAQELALRHPERVAALLLVSTLPSVPMLGFKARILGSRLAITRYHPRPVARFFVRFFEPWLTLDQADMVLDHFYRAHHPTLRTIGRGLLAFNALDRLDRVRCPVRVIVGAGDRYLLEPSQELQRRIPGADRVVVPDSGHGMPIEKPQEFLQSVREFLEATTPR